MPPGAAVTEVLVRFARTVASAREPEAVMSALAVAAVEHLGAAGAAVLMIREDGELEVSEAPGMPAEIRGWKTPADDLGPALGDRLLALCGDRFRAAHTHVLASSGDLFGAFVLFFAEPGAAPTLAPELADVAALALAEKRRIAALERSNRELRSARDAIARGEKLRLLGQMAAGVSHDIKNLLNPVLLYAQLLSRHPQKAPEDIDDLVETIEGTVKRALETLERFRDFTREAPSGSAPAVELDAVVGEAVRLSLPRLPGGDAAVHLRQSLASDARVALLPADLVTAIANLVTNAIEAMPRGGTIWVETRVEGARAVVEVRDDGPGMSPEIEARVFEPFFTTKGTEGTGLGLAMVYATVRRYGGTIALDTEPGSGTRFTFSFPLASRAV
jgi:signal transduction histidine kinase